MGGAGPAGPRRTRPDWGHAPDAPAPKPRAAKPAPKPTKKLAKKPVPKPAARPATKPAAKRAAPASKRAAAPARTRGASSRSRPAKRPAKRRGPARAGSFQKRYGVVHDLEGPRVTLGICWFVLAAVAIAGGALTTALVYGTAAAVAAAQMARCWRKERMRPSDVMAAGGAGLIAAGASFGAGGAGLGMLAAVVLAFVGAAGDLRSPNARIADIGWTVQCALAPGVVAMSMVLLTRLDQGSAIALLLLVSAYETGDFLIGSGAKNPYEGPAAGGAAIVVITFIVSTIFISSLSFGQAWLFGGAVALLAPAGQLLASALLPAANAPASALRRIDSLLLCAPVWAWGVGLVINS